MAVDGALARSVLLVGRLHILQTSDHAREHEVIGICPWRHVVREPTMRAAVRPSLGLAVSPGATSRLVDARFLTKLRVGGRHVEHAIGRALARAAFLIGCINGVRPSEARHGSAVVLQRNNVVLE